MLHHTVNMAKIYSARGKSKVLLYFLAEIVLSLDLLDIKHIQCNPVSLFRFFPSREAELQWTEKPLKSTLARLLFAAELFFLFCTSSFQADMTQYQSTLDKNP